jgi:hypothetical protein
LEEYESLIDPWEPEDEFVSLIDWHGFDRSLMDEEDRKAFSSAGAGYGAYLAK